jgi:hypothetical protein
MKRRVHSFYRYTYTIYWGGQTLLAVVSVTYTFLGVRDTCNIMTSPLRAGCKNILRDMGAIYE